MNRPINRDGPIPANFRRQILKLQGQVMKKVGPRVRPAVVKIEITAGLKAFLRQRYNIRGRWNPIRGAQHRQFLQEAGLEIASLRPGLGLFRIAVVEFKTSTTSPTRFTDEDGQERTVNVAINHLAMRFTTQAHNGPLMFVGH